MSKRNGIWQEVELELRKAKRKFPNWPDHVCAKAGIVCEESGELMRAALQYKYETAIDETGKQKQIENMRTEAIQTAAMAIRFLENL